MNPKAIGRLVALLLVLGKADANAQPDPCSVYFTVIENDEVTLHLPIFEMNKPQNIWYENYGNRDQYSGMPLLLRLVRHSTPLCGVCIWRMRLIFTALNQPSPPMGTAR